MTPYSINHHSKVPFKRRYLIVPVAIVLGILITLAILEKTNTINLIHQSPDSNTTGSSDGINYNPPTKEDAQAVDETKENLPDANKTPTPSPTPPGSNPSSKKTVKPIIASVSDTAVRGIIPGVLENGGTCIATFTKSGQTTVTKSGTASADAQNTICAVNYAGSGPGTGWSVTLTYSSTTSEGTSDASTL